VADATPVTLEEIRAFHALGESRAAEKGVDTRKRIVEIYDDFCCCDTGRRVIRIPQPTLAFLMLYNEQREYFWDDGHGLGRLLAALRRQKEGRGEYIRGLRIGEKIPDEEADAAMSGVYAEDKVDYYAMVHAADKLGKDETKKKMAKLFWGKMDDMPSALTALLLNLSSLPDIPSTNSSTKCTLAHSET